MSTPIVRADGPPGQSPPVPERMDIETEWTTTTPDGDRVTVELWSDRGRRDAELRILRGAVLGTLASKIPDMESIPSPAAVEQYGADWVARELRSASQSLAVRWGVSAFDRRRR